MPSENKILIKIVISGWQKSKKSVSSVGDKQIFPCYPCVPCEVKVISNSCFLLFFAGEVELCGVEEVLPNDV